MHRGLALLIILPLLTITAMAQDIRVDVRVDCVESVPLCDQVASKVNKRLRDFRDVEVTSTNPELIIYILPIESTVGDRVVRIAWAVAVTSPFNNLELDRLISLYTGAKAKQEVRAYYKDSPMLEDLRIQTFAPGDIDGQALALVETIDSKHIERLRRAKQAKPK